MGPYQRTLPSVSCDRAFFDNQFFFFGVRSVSCGSDFLDLGVSKYRGTPNSSMFNRIFQYFHHPVLKIDYLEEGGGRVVFFFHG